MHIDEGMIREFVRLPLEAQLCVNMLCPSKFNQSMIQELVKFIASRCMCIYMIEIAARAYSQFVV
ncbi:hypothetical protein D3C75_1048510 [compost metagenome]